MLAYCTHFKGRWLNISRKSMPSRLSFYWMLGPFCTRRTGWVSLKIGFPKNRLIVIFIYAPWNVFLFVAIWMYMKDHESSCFFCAKISPIFRHPVWHCMTMLTVALGKSRIAGISINTEFHRSVVEVLPGRELAISHNFAQFRSGARRLMYIGGCKARGSQNHQNHHKWGL